MGRHGNCRIWRKLWKRTTRLCKHCGAVYAEMESLSRDAQMWRSQNDAAKVSRTAVEKEFKEARQSFAGEKMKLQAAIDRLSSQTTSTEEEIKRTWDHIEEFRRLSGARET